VPAAFGAARHFDQISGSGFEKVVVPMGSAVDTDRAVRIPPSRGRLADILEVELESFGLRFGSDSKRSR
jgi:hypothetical protein